LEGVAMQGILYIVSTPIGNLEDITYRAVRVMQECDKILAEDTRHTRFLLDHYRITTHAESYHDFNKEKVTARYIEDLKSGQNIALVSDAGTPGVADPAFYIVREAIKNEIRVEPVPGASALLAGLVISGLPTDKFCFEGFAAKKSAQRLRRLQELQESVYTVCFYVSPHQLVKFLGEIQTVFGAQFEICVLRELTKKFEEHLRGPVQNWLLHYKERTPRGEYVLLFHPTKQGLLHETDTNDFAN
jgi:16S rRNA (cytidine1402-2'-O)-methyltransferase